MSSSISLEDGELLGEFRQRGSGALLTCSSEAVQRPISGAASSLSFLARRTGRADALTWIG